MSSDHRVSIIQAIVLSRLHVIDEVLEPLQEKIRLNPTGSLDFKMDPVGAPFDKIGFGFLRENTKSGGTRSPLALQHMTEVIRQLRSAAVKVPICFYSFLANLKLLWEV